MQTIDLLSIPASSVSMQGSLSAATMASSSVPATTLGSPVPVKRFSSTLSSSTSPGQAKRRSPGSLVPAKGTSSNTSAGSSVLVKRSSSIMVGSSGLAKRRSPDILVPAKRLSSTVLGSCSLLPVRSRSPASSVPAKRLSSSRKVARKTRKVRKPFLKLSSRHKPTSPSTLQSFPQFSLLPTELRLRIWAFAAHNNPRVLDIWAGYNMCSQNDAEFYVLKYSCYLANKHPHPMLSVCHQSREEGLKHFTLEYKTVFSCHIYNHVNPARFYINYNSDILMPKGFWHPCAYQDFKTRNLGRLRNLALDVSGCYFKTTLSPRSSPFWDLEGLDDLILYDSTQGGMVENPTSDTWDMFYLFERKRKGGRKATRFIEARGETALLFRGVEDLAEYFKRHNQKDKVPAVLAREPAHVDGDGKAKRKTEFVFRKGAQTTTVRIKSLMMAIPQLR